MTRVRCVVRECKNASYKNDSNCSFHDFPANKELSEKWVSQIIKYEEFCGWVSNVASRITNNTKICSEHFEKTCFQKSGEKKRLLPTAIPKLFPKPKGVHLSGKSYPVTNSQNLEKEETPNSESAEVIPDSDHTYGKRVIQPINAQQQKELQPNQDDDVVLLPSPMVTTQPLSITTSRAPYDLTGRMIEGSTKTLPAKRLVVSKPAFILPVPTSAGNQPLVTNNTQQPKEPILTSCLDRLGEHTARFAYHTQPNEALQLNSSGADSNDDVISSKKARVDPPPVAPPISAPNDLSGRMIHESQQTIPINSNTNPASNPTVTLPMLTPASNQGFLILVPQPIFTFPPPIISTIPSSNRNCFQISTPVTSSVVPREAVTQNVQVQQQQQLSKERNVESNCQPDEKLEMLKKPKDRRDTAYANQVNMVRKLRGKIQQMERAHAKLLNTVGFALLEKGRKDVRVKRLFRSLDAMLSGDENGEDHPAFLIDQVLNFNAKTPKQVKYSQATMRSCFALNAKSASTYEFIRNQGVLILPSRVTLATHTKKASTPSAMQNDEVSNENDVLADALLSLESNDLMD